MTPAEELRTAAKLMREQAEAAAPAPWTARHLRTSHFVLSAAGEGVITSGMLGDLGPADTDYIAGMHPGVALAVADWLEGVAGWLEAAEAWSPGTPADSSWIKPAFAVARAYLGTGEGKDGSDE